MLTDSGGRLVNLSDDWHDYGALVTRDWFVVYLDRIEIGRFPMVEILRQPLYPQLTLSILNRGLAAGGSRTRVSPMDLQIDDVRIYRRPASPASLRLLGSPSGIRGVRCWTGEARRRRRRPTISLTTTATQAHILRR